MTNEDYNKAKRKLNSDLERYEIIISYFQRNRDRVKPNQKILTTLKESVRYSETKNNLARKEACVRTNLSDILEAQKWSEILKC